MDFSSHMRNTAYLDKSADVRMMYFSCCGFSVVEFMRLPLQPVVELLKPLRELARSADFRILDGSVRSKA